MVLAHSPKAPGSWVLWGHGPVELRRVSTCLSQLQSVLPRLTSVFHWQPVNSQWDQWPSPPLSLYRWENGVLFIVAAQWVITSSPVEGPGSFHRAPAKRAVILHLLCLDIIICHTVSVGDSVLFLINPVPLYLCSYSSGVPLVSSRHLGLPREYVAISRLHLREPVCPHCHFSAGCAHTPVYQVWDKMASFLKQGAMVWPGAEHIGQGQPCCFW